MTYLFQSWDDTWNFLDHKAILWNVEQLNKIEIKQWIVSGATPSKLSEETQNIDKGENVNIIIMSQIIWCYGISNSGSLQK